MRKLANYEVGEIFGGTSFGPSLSNVVSFAAKEAVPVMVGSAVGLTLRNLVGWDNRSVNEILCHSVLSGIAFIAAFTATVVYQDPDVLSR